jgi:hypothetical protein
MDEKVTIEPFHEGHTFRIRVESTDSNPGPFNVWQSVTMIEDMVPIGTAIRRAIRDHYFGLAKKKTERWGV